MKNNIRELRIKNNLTQKELGYALGISYQGLASYETERRQPTPEMLCKIADYFQVSIDYIVKRSINYGGITYPQYTEFTEEEQEVMRVYREIDEEDKTAVKKILGSFHANKKIKK